MVSPQDAQPEPAPPDWNVRQNPLAGSLAREKAVPLAELKGEERESKEAREAGEDRASRQTHLSRNPEHAIDVFGLEAADEEEEQDHPCAKEFRKERRRAMVAEARLNANLCGPPKNVSMFTPAYMMGMHFGIGIGLYLKLLEWLLILFACITFLAIPYWITINTSVFTDSAHKDDHEFGVKVYDTASLMSTTFASIVDQRIDPNTTLKWMNTRLGDVWHGPMEKNTFLLWVSLLDVIAVCVMIGLATYFTWKSRWFERRVDEDTFDATDYTVLVTGLPKNAGVHEIGKFFSRFGEIMDVTPVLDMNKVLRACARASHLEHKRELQADQLRVFNTPEHRERIEKTEAELVKVLREIDEDMNKNLAQREKERVKAAQKLAKKQAKARKKGKHMPIGSDALDAAKEEEERDAQLLDNVAHGITVIEQGETRNSITNRDASSLREITKESVYDTKAAFVTFNRMSEQRRCLKLCPDPGWTGWLYGSTMATESQRMRGCCVKTQRACAPNDYIFENMTVHKFVRFLHLLATRIVILIILIACAIIVTGLSSIEVLERSELSWTPKLMKEDIGRAGAALSSSSDPVGVQLYTEYETAMRSAAGTTGSTPSFSPKLAAKANFQGFCELALPDSCAAHYGEQLSVPNLGMRWGLHVLWPKALDKLLNQRPLFGTMEELAEAEDPQEVEGTDTGLSSCLACYCLGLYDAQQDGVDAATEGTGKTSAEWLAQTQSECEYYLGKFDVKSWGTRVAVSIVIALLNITLKLLAQFLGKYEMHWTQSAKERSFAVVAFMSQLLNTVLVLLLVNARPAANATPQGDRVGEDDISWLRYIILRGQFDDFSPGWYQYVGVSVMTLLLIQTIFPLVNVGLEMLLKGLKLAIVKWKKTATQDEFNSAYAYPNFLLQQRVADVMLNVMVALLFCSGMPFCAAIVIVVFSSAILMDRFAITKLMTVTRYSTQLPRLIIDLLPWAIFFHTLFGLWQHTYFMLQNDDNESTAVFIQMGKEEAQRKRGDSGEFFGEFIDARSVLSRISQPNGFGLLICAFLMFIWIIFRYVIKGIVAPMILRWMDGKEADNLATGGTSALGRLRFFRKLMAAPRIRALPGLHLQGLAGDDEEEQEGEEGDRETEVTFENAIKTGKLKGTPTYRLPFQPAYSAVFSGLLHGAIWMKMLGPERFTRLVPSRGEEIHALPDPSAPQKGKSKGQHPMVEFMEDVTSEEQEGIMPISEREDAAAHTTMVKSGSLPRVRNSKAVAERALVWTISPELILSARDQALSEASVEQVFKQKGLGDELARGVASMVAASAGSAAHHMRVKSKGSSGSSSPAHSRASSVLSGPAQLTPSGIAHIHPIRPSRLGDAHKASHHAGVGAEHHAGPHARPHGDGMGAEPHGLSAGPHAVSDAHKAGHHMGPHAGNHGDGASTSAPGSPPSPHPEEEASDRPDTPLSVHSPGAPDYQSEPEQGPEGIYTHFPPTTDTHTPGDATPPSFVTSPSTERHAQPFQHDHNDHNGSQQHHHSHHQSDAEAPVWGAVGGNMLYPTIPPQGAQQLHPPQQQQHQEQQQQGQQDDVHHPNVLV